MIRKEQLEEGSLFDFRIAFEDEFEVNIQKKCPEELKSKDQNKIDQISRIVLLADELLKTVSDKTNTKNLIINKITVWKPSKLNDILLKRWLTRKDANLK